MKLDVAFTTKPKWIIVSPKLYYLPKFSPTLPVRWREFVFMEDRASGTALRRRTFGTRRTRQTPSNKTESALFSHANYIDVIQKEVAMFKKIISYLGFGKNRPAYHVKGSAYGGLRMDIDKYYQDEKNQKKLKKISNSEFGQMFDSKGNKKKELEETASAT